MGFEQWKEHISDFEPIDVRHLQGNFFPGLQKRAAGLGRGCGLTIIQTFEPLPLYAPMEALGFDHFTQQVGEEEFHTYFYREREVNRAEISPLRPVALLNYPMIDERLGQIAVDFWDLTWNDQKRTLPYEMRLLLSLANAVGAGRMRQATRELVKAYIHGIDSAALDDVFELLAWNQGIGYFSSEIGPSQLFQAYKLIKNREKSGKQRSEIEQELMENFGEKNPEVKVH